MPKAKDRSRSPSGTRRSERSESESRESECISPDAKIKALEAQVFKLSQQVSLLMHENEKLNVSLRKQEGWQEVRAKRARCETAQVSSDHFPISNSFDTLQVEETSQMVIDVAAGSQEWPTPAQHKQLSQSKNVSANQLNKGKSLKLSQQGYYVLQKQDNAAPVSQSPASPGTSQPDKPQRSPPPIIIHGDSHFQEVKLLAEGNQVKILRYKPLKDELHVFVETPGDFRALRGALEGSGIPFHHFQLPEEKELKIVLRPVPLDITVEEVEEDLRSQGFEFNSVVRMRRGSRIFPMVLVNASRCEEGRRCFDIPGVLGIKVRAEPKRKPTSGAQCFKCQRHGHVSYRCNGDVRCAFCLTSHPKDKCPNPRGYGQTAQCVLCQGNHPAFSKECPKHPEKIKELREKARKAQLQAAERKEGVTYAQQTLGKTPPDPIMSPELMGLIERTVRDTIKQLLPTLLRQTNG